jgi:hypothetical protein
MLLPLAPCADDFSHSCVQAGEADITVALCFDYSITASFRRALGTSAVADRRHL